MNPTQYQELVRESSRERSRQLMQTSRARTIREARLRRYVGARRSAAAA